MTLEQAREKLLDLVQELEIALQEDECEEPVEWLKDELLELYNLAGEG